MNERFKQIFTRVKTFAGTKTKKQWYLFSGIAALIILIIVLSAIFATRQTLVPLYSNLTPSETGMIKETLDGRAIPSEITEGGTAILVPEAQAETLMVELAAEGIPNSGNIDYSFFSENAGFGMTDNEFKVMHVDAMQTEIATLLKSIDGVQDATVMITIPEQGVFLNDNPEQSSASVVVNTQPGYQFDEGQINSLYHLVSKSVPDLPTENIVIMNQFFEYFDMKDQDSSFAGVNLSDQMALKQTIERDLQRQVQMMLGTLVGQDKVVVSVSTDIDFDQENREENLVTPVDEENMEGIEISARRITETFEGTNAAGGVPEGEDPADNLVGFVEGDQGNGDYEREEETINNEVNRIRREIVESPYRIRDIGFQVMVEPPDPEDPATLPQQSIDDIETMLETIISTSIDADIANELTPEEITDKVVVSAQTFNGRADFAEAEVAPVIPLWAYIVGGVLLLVIIGLIFFIIRSRRQVEEEEVFMTVEEPIDVPDVNNEKETEGTLKRKQLEKMAKEKPEEFAKLLRSWIADE
ncbi:flagellar basal-body MS-ring/collar protein FliF [Jeotgalibacillus salarius]|uniref:Flagellar M-ring protein n=1 Tax=Jeotgalibacillus salarius TaxID=546023 RepID=A0A4Y8LJJ5_9BACL|nr:flagellar basal-body MS-ring/collar protein FliF [Jeotgalibacillus salarius]TFE02755.1 flagellar basal body M-ring protein FliF [Jeotgalibacillus salarius]